MLPNPPAPFRCAICLCDGTAEMEKDGQWTLLRCRSCSSLRLEPLPSEKELATLYGPSYRSRSGGKRFIAPVEALVRSFRLKRFHSILRRNPNAQSILDIGCGRGDLLVEFKHRNWKVAGTEFNQESVTFNQARGVDVRLGGTEQIPEGTFDVVTLIHVLEHVPDLDGVFSAIDRRSRVGTQLLIEIPNGSSVCHEWFGSSWFGRDLPNHVHQINPRALSRSLSKRGWALEQSIQWSLEFGPYSLGQSVANALIPAWHNRAYQWLQTPSLKPSALAPALLQLMVLLPFAAFYPVFFALTAPSGKSEIAQLWFRKT